MLIGDCASDPPLAATQRTLAAARAGDVVYGLGAVALARGHRQLALAVADAGARASLLVLPARHTWVRRLRTTVGDWLWRAASACEGCRACSEACPAGLEAHALVATLATARDDGTAPAAFAACTGCGVCDAACPSSLSPRALAVEVRDRLQLAAAAPTRHAGIDRALLTLRLGLGPYDRP